MLDITLTDKSVAMERIGARSSKFHVLIREGLMVPPVHVGRSARFPAHEINVIAAAHMAGVSDDKIRALVADLVAKRPEIFAKWRAAVTAAAL